METINSPYAHITIEDNILFFTYHKIDDFDLNVAKRVVQDRLSLQREKAYPILCDIRKLSIPSLEARRYLALQGSILTKAVAYLTTTHGSNSLTQFFIRVDQPTIPAELFTMRHEALLYLKKYI